MRESFYDLNQGLLNLHVEENGFNQVRSIIKMVNDTKGPHGSRIFFIGNGGSAAIASHMAIDWMKNGKMPTMCFNDAAALTCISNDLGYGSVFALPLKMHAKFGDVLFAISSSGESINILNAVNYAKDNHMNVVTLSGFDPDNNLRKLGHVNFYVPSRKYGTVEIAHLAILHSILDEVIDGA